VERDDPGEAVPAVASRYARDVAWSTRQLADLAGTTVKTVRHYHRMELLALPERTANGYKQYQVSHLVRLLQIRRLTEVGLSLAQIRELSGPDQDPDAAVRALDAELEATIARLQRVRAELAVVIEHGVPLDTPPAFGTVARGLSERDRGLLAVLSQVLDAGELDDVRALMADVPDDDEAALLFAALPEDADDAAIEAAAVALAPSMRSSTERFPWMSDLREVAPRGPKFAQDAVLPAVADLFSPAQLQALARANEIVRKAVAEDG
jgi:MerR family transcriptional regulator, thiopeptide resistance regulator